MTETEALQSVQFVTVIGQVTNLSYKYIVVIL